MSTVGSSGGSSTKIVLIGVVAVVLAGLVVYFVEYLFPHLVTAVHSELYKYGITSYIGDCYSKVYEFKVDASELRLVLTSSYDYMCVKVIVDGMVVFRRCRVYHVDFRYYMGPGVHVVHIVITNPGMLCLGKTILVTGEVEFS